MCLKDSLKREAFSSGPPSACVLYIKKKKNWHAVIVPVKHVGKRYRFI